MYFVRVSSSSEVGSVKTYVENVTKIWGFFFQISFQVSQNSLFKKYIR